jgi:hypothetical protein
LWALIIYKTSTQSTIPQKAAQSSLTTIVNNQEILLLIADFYDTPDDEPAI